MRYQTFEITFDGRRRIRAAVMHRKPLQIMNEIAALDAEGATVLMSIRELL